MRLSPGTYTPWFIRLEQGSLKEREEEAKRQDTFECWETKTRRDQSGKKEYNR